MINVSIGAEEKIGKETAGKNHSDLISGLKILKKESVIRSEHFCNIY